MSTGSDAEDDVAQYPPLVVLVLLSLHIILQEDLNLLVHLRPYVLQEAARNDSEPSKTDRCERHGPVCLVSSTTMPGLE